MLERRIDPRLQARLDPDDVLHDAFLLAQSRWAAFRDAGGLSPYAWLYRAVLDTVVNHWRKETRGRRDPRREIPWPEESAAALGMGLVDSGTRPSEAARRHETESRMKQALDLLKPSHREVLWMRQFDQLSYREIGEVLGISENAAAVRYVRAVERLRGLWEQIAPSEGNANA
jgi:RNA polymerase sigma-70 factor (ECF subfamily)